MSRHKYHCCREQEEITRYAPEKRDHRRLGLGHRQIIINNKEERGRQPGMLENNRREQHRKKEPL